MPEQRSHFFCISTRNSARSARAFNFALSRSSSAIRFAVGSTAFGFGPRLFGIALPSSPRSRAPRHVARCDEYSPSRRSTAAISPGPQRSASAKIRRLYSLVNWRRFPLAGTSGSGLSVAALSSFRSPSSARVYRRELNA